MKTLIKQMWAGKRENGWIFIELIIIFVVTWMVIDPIYVIQYQRHGIKEGFDPDNLYMANISVYSQMAPDYDSTRMSKEALTEDAVRIMNIVKTLPEIEAVTLIDGNRPWSSSYNGDRLMNPEDSSISYIQLLTLFNNEDFFKVFRYRSALDHKWESFDKLELPSNGIIISEDSRQQLFKDNPAIGKTLNVGGSDYIVSGVMEMVKRAPSEQPAPCILYQKNYIYPSGYNNVGIAIRVKSGISEMKFLNDFKDKVAPKMQSGNLYFNEISSYYSYGDLYSSWDGSSKTLQMRGVLSAFYLLVVFLGIISTFWLRVETRKEETGLRMALGCTKNKIRNRMLSESLLLVLFASVIGLIITANIVYFKGMYSFTNNAVVFPAVDSTIPHFAIVTLITLVLIIAVVAIATIIPANRATKINPIDALRDE
ncbi:MAG: FtsX-like permease family protein [Bacteroidales bacterium]|nr:FtsX-like permease family protein [Bacteroidales bacterium]MDD4669750.1 FtsX-like permease family protein [Bacteroidales bacterium]